MSTQADQLGERAIVTGRAYVRLIEAADVLLDHRPAWTERGLLRLCRLLTTPLLGTTLEIAVYPSVSLVQANEMLVAR